MSAPRGVRRPRPGKVRALLVVLVLLAAGGVVYALGGLANQQLLPLIEGVSLAVVALLCLLLAMRRTRMRR